MTILALEFSSPQRSVALARDGELLAQVVQYGRERGTAAVGLIEKLLVAARVSRESINAVAVGLGPGSYTGIRAAIAVAQGWQLARGARLFGVKSLEALAIEAREKRIFGRVNLVVDAQRGEFYLAEWDVSEAACVEVSPVRIVAADEVKTLKQAGAVCAGPEMMEPLYPSAMAIATLAAKAIAVDGATLSPIYLRETSFVKAPTARII